MLSRRARINEWGELLENPVFQGGVVNIDSAHWTALVKHEGLIFYVDSMRAPQFVDAADFQSLLKTRPDVYFVVSVECGAE